MGKLSEGEGLVARLDYLECVLCRKEKNLRFYKQRHIRKTHEVKMRILRMQSDIEILKTAIDRVTLGELDLSDLINPNVS